jgi:hypothetical protein
MLGLKCPNITHSPEIRGKFTFLLSHVFIFRILLLTPSSNRENPSSFIFLLLLPSFFFRSSKAVRGGGVRTIGFRARTQPKCDSTHLQCYASTDQRRGSTPEKLSCHYPNCFQTDLKNHKTCEIHSIYFRDVGGNRESP